MNEIAAGNQESVRMMKVSSWSPKRVGKKGPKRARRKIALKKY